MLYRDRNLGPEPLGKHNSKDKPVKKGGEEGDSQKRMKKREQTDICFVIYNNGFLYKRPTSSQSMTSKLNMV